MVLRHLPKVRMLHPQVNTGAFGPSILLPALPDTDWFLESHAGRWSSGPVWEGSSVSDFKPLSEGL